MVFVRVDENLQMDLVETVDYSGKYAPIASDAAEKSLHL